MLDRELYEALETLKRYETQGRGPYVITTEKPGLEASARFDHLVECAIELKKQGYVDFREKGQLLKNHRLSDRNYLSLEYEINYRGNKVLSHGSFEAYRRAHSSTPRSSGVHIDNRFTVHGGIHGSNVASHSKDVRQSQYQNPEVEEILERIVRALEKDAALSETERSDKIADVETLRSQLTRSTPRPEIIRTIYGDIANTASIASFATQLLPHLAAFLPS